MVSHSHKFVFLHIPKNAGTSIEKFFVEQKVAPQNFKFGVNVHYDNITEDIANNYFIFAIKRNPWDRFISLWKYWTSVSRITKKYKLEKSLDYFCNNIDYIKSILPQKEHIHFLNQVDINNQPSYVKPIWFSFENLDDDFAHICSRIGIPQAKLKRENPSRPEDKNYQDFYTPELKKSVEKMYARDIDYFKYSF